MALHKGKSSELPKKEEVNWYVSLDLSEYIVSMHSDLTKILDMLLSKIKLNVSRKKKFLLY